MVIGDIRLVKRPSPRCHRRPVRKPEENRDMGAILTWAGILVVIGIVSIWWSRRTTEDHEMDSSQWIDTDFSDHQGHAHGDYSRMATPAGIHPRTGRILVGAVGIEFIPEPECGGFLIHLCPRLPHSSSRRRYDHFSPWQTRRSPAGPGDPRCPRCGLRGPDSTVLLRTAATDRQRRPDADPLGDP